MQTAEKNKKRFHPGSRFIIALLLAGAVFCLIKSDIFPWSPEEEIQLPPSPTPTSEKPADSPLPEKALFITVERQHYQSGDLKLLIPKLSIDAPIWNGTTPEDLQHGACLYDYAQLPGDGDRNVSIAAHRNGIKDGKPNDNALFYYIDTLKDGDYLYLTDQTNVYRYLYKDTVVVNEDDWGPIYTQGFSCLTLTTCTPIGISDHRLIVRGILDEIFPLTDDFQYIADSLQKQNS